MQPLEDGRHRRCEPCGRCIFEWYRRGVGLFFEHTSHNRAFGVRVTKEPIDRTIRPANPTGLGIGSFDSRVCLETYRSNNNPMVSLKNPALDFQVSGSWVGFAVDQTTHTVVKEIYSPHGSYLLEIHNPRADEKGIYYIWGIWHTA